MGLFGKAPDPKEQIGDWKKSLRHEQRAIERQIKKIEREEFKIQLELKKLAKAGDLPSCKVLARSLVDSKRQRNRMHATKTQINSVSMNIQNQLAMVKVAGVMEKSAAVMSAMQQLVRLPEIQATMMQLSKEMTKAGLIEEMMEDSFDNVFESEELDEEAEVEVSKVLMELTDGAFADVIVPDGALPQTGPEEAEEEEVASASDTTDLRARLQALKSS